MKKWFVILLVLLALIVLVSPGIVGRLAEQNLKDSLSWAKSESDDFRFTEEAFDRGWFTAAGRHRVELNDGNLHATLVSVLGLEAGESLPALVVDTRIDHGLVPVTSMARESGSLIPGLASTVSTLYLDRGDGELIPVPGRVYSRVGLTGETASRYQVGAGAFTRQGAAAEWQGADIVFNTNASSRAIRYRGDIEPVAIEAEGNSLHLGATTFRGDMTKSGFGFSVGGLELQMGGMSARLEDGNVTSFDRLEMNAGSELEGERVNGRSALQITGFTTTELERADLAVEFVANRLDARALQGIVAALQSAQQAPDPDAAIATLYPRIEGDLQRLLAAGVELRFDRFDIALPEGELTSRLNLDLPETNTRGFSWPTLLLALTASADLSVPATLVQMAQDANPQSNALIAMGILKKEGANYVMDARYAKGLLTINGAPMPIPLPQ